MKTLLQHFLIVLAVTSISCSEVRSNEKRRDKSERWFHSRKIKDNICELTDREFKVHCYCENTEVKMATRADCWVFNGGIEENDPLWSTFSAQPNLERLTFSIRSDGALKFIPLHVIHQLKRLQKLNIHFATINKLEKKTFSNITSLREIILLKNKITVLDFSSFTNLPALVNLTIKENRLTEIQRDVFVDLPSLRYLDLSFNNINLVHDGCFEHLTVLNDLILEANSITVLTRDTFRGLANLTRLDLRSNKLSMVGDLTFTELWNLNELLLDNNELKYLSERAFDGLVLLQKLSMTGNKLKSINEGLLEGIRGLDLLDLRNNAIEFFTFGNVKPIIENLKMKTSVLYLSGNQLKCDCRLSWIKGLRNETKSEILRAALDEITCIADNTADSPPSINISEVTKNLFDVVTSASEPQGVNEEELYEETNQYYIPETTIPPLKLQVALNEVSIEALPCPNELTQNKEDSLMLSSNDEGFWRRSSSLQHLSNLRFVIIIALINTLR